MDVELLFSRSPFAQDNLDGFSLIRPNFFPCKLPLDNKVDDAKSQVAGRGIHEFELPVGMQNKNVLVELVGGDQPAQSLTLLILWIFNWLKNSVN
jgi:hypothetical protein